MLQDEEWEKWSDREIAIRCKVDHKTVGKSPVIILNITKINTAISIKWILFHSKSLQPFCRHGIDMNIMMEDTLYNSSRLGNFNSLPSPIQSFIEDIKRDSELRWGGDFSNPDPVHIDDGLNLRDRTTYDAKFPLIQRELRNGPLLPGATHEVIARSGLRLRSGPGLGFDTIELLPLGTLVIVRSTQDDWSAIDREGDGSLDGFVFSSFLRQL